MDVLRNMKSMTAGQFCSLQLFECVYLMALAFLPFIVALPEISYIILCIFTIVAIVAVIKKYNSRVVDPAGKVVLITGCDSGFGHACARQLVSYGFTIVAGCYDINSEGASRLRETASGNLQIVKLDITNEENVQQVMLKIKNICHSRNLWALVNNAGVSGFGNVEFMSLDTYKNVMNVNILGTLRITKACLPLIRAAKGRVIMMSGSSGKLSLPGQSALSVSGFALEAVSDALRLELKPFEVKVITIRPGNFAGATGMLNKSGLEKIRLVFDAIKQTTDPEILSSYGQNFLDNQYRQLMDLSKSTATSLINMTDAVENAIRNQNPKSQVFVDGGNQLVDWGNVLIHLHPYLPCSLFDLLVSKLCDTRTDNVINQSLKA